MKYKVIDEYLHEYLIYRRNWEKVALNIILTHVSLLNIIKAVSVLAI